LQVIKDIIKENCWKDETDEYDGICSNKYLRLSFNEFGRVIISSV
jgi:hypothetical protein